MFILFLAIVLAAILIYINWTTTPLPENKRNISTTDIKMIADIPDVANRTPIIRTFTKNEFSNFSEKKLKKIKNIVDGNIEGDIPALKIENGVGRIKIRFEKSERENKVEITPDNIPRIKLFVSEFLYDGMKYKQKEINDSFKENKEKGIYEYEIKFYLKENSTYSGLNDTLYMESIIIEVYYEIDEKEYVSFFAINAIEDK